MLAPPSKSTALRTNIDAPSWRKHSRWWCVRVCSLVSATARATPTAGTNILQIFSRWWCVCMCFLMSAKRAMPSWHKHSRSRWRRQSHLDVLQPQPGASGGWRPPHFPSKATSHILGCTLSHAHVQAGTSAYYVCTHRRLPEPVTILPPTSCECARACRHLCRAMCGRAFDRERAPRTCCAWMPRRVAVDRPCARGEPPPQGRESMRLRAMAIDLEGGSSTSALSPKKGTRATCAHTGRVPCIYASTYPCIHVSMHP